jgi:hypothetical protein
MMIESLLHHYFGNFLITFKATTQAHTYQIVNYHQKNAYLQNTLPTSGPVVLVNHNTGYELPDPILLQTHTIITRILHATGKGEEVEKILRDQDKTSVLAKDGSTDISRLLSATALGNLSSRPLGQRLVNMRQPSPSSEGKARSNPHVYPSVDIKKENIR